MIKRCIHIALAFLLSLPAIAQHQDVFFELLSEAKTSNTQLSITQHEQLLREDEKLTKNLCLALDEIDANQTIFHIANLHQNKPWASYYLAREAALNGNAETACQFLRKHLESTQRFPRSTIRSCDDFKAISNSKAWNTLWANDFYKDEELRYETACNYFENGDYTWALDEINALIQDFPIRHAYYALKAKIFLAQEQYNPALWNIEKALDGSTRHAEYYLISAQVLAKLNRENKAISALESAEKLNPYLCNAIKLDIELSWQLGDTKRAISKAENYLRYFDDIEVQYMLADAKITQGDYTDAIRLMNEVLEKDQSKPAYFVARADAFRGTRSWQNAMKDYSMALDLDPKQAEVYIHFGICRFESGDREGACYLWKRALHYKHPEANQYLYEWCE